MNINPIYNSFTAPNPISFQKKSEQKNNTQNINDYNFSTTQVTGAVLATALSATIIAGSIIRGKNKTIKSLEKDVAGLKESYISLKDSNRTYVESTKDLQYEIIKLKEKLKKHLISDYDEVNPKILEYMRVKIGKGKLKYDYKTPPITGKKKYTRIENGFDYDDTIVVGTRNREYIRELKIPEIAPDGSFVFEIPTSQYMEIQRAGKVDFKPMKNVSTSISEKYADSVQWDDDKIARDILQNPFDGHGQTLDGVKFIFTPLKNGKYRIRIESKSTYTPDKAVYIGETTKRDNAKAAGNYGEGLKMAALKLLRDKGADSVKYGSLDWQVDYSLAKGNLSDKRVLTYSLDKIDDFDGNFIEFETNDRSLLETFRKTINRFYHSANTHFKCPEFENEHFGIKILPEGEKGALYIAGQRFEYGGSYDGIEGAVLFIKEKPPVAVLDPSRDRTSINDSQLESLASWLSKDCTSQTEKIQVFKTLERYMMYKPLTEDTPAMEKFLKQFVYFCDSGNQSISHLVNFPEKYVAYSNCDADVLNDLRNSGYTICSEKYIYAGMRTISDVIGEVRQHDVIAPDRFQIQKISIIKQALHSLSKALKDKHFTEKEIDTKIFLFKNDSSLEDAMYSHTRAEAIIDNKESKGFWIDVNYLNQGSFSDVLGTALHELCHKVGGDSSADFSYKLTDVNRDVIHQILTNSTTKNELHALNILWKEISTKANEAYNAV